MLEKIYQVRFKNKTINRLYFAVVVAPAIAMDCINKSIDKSFRELVIWGPRAVFLVYKITFIEPLRARE